MDTPIPVDLGRIAQDLQIRRVQVDNVVQLLDEGNTVPFITRYRKERTGALNEVIIREIQARLTRMRELAERKDTILKTIEQQGKLTDELQAAIRAAENTKRLEDLYLPYKPKKRTKATDARDRGLEPLALAVWNHEESVVDLTAAATAFLNPEKEVDTPEKALEGAGHILAEMISETAAVRDSIRRLIWKIGKLVTTKSDSVVEGQGLDFRDYFNFSEPIHHIPPHRVLAINRGDKEGSLKVKLDVPRLDLESAIKAPLPLEGHPHAAFLENAATDALDRLILPSLEREVRRDLTETAERHAVEVFARNLNNLLLQPPIQSQVVMAIDPGFRNGCKVAVTDPYGKLLEHTTLFPHPPQGRRSEAKIALKDLVGKHHVTVVAIGNGTACRETEELIAEIIAEGTHFLEHPDEPYTGPGSQPPTPPPPGSRDAEHSVGELVGKDDAATSSTSHAEVGDSPAEPHASASSEGSATTESAPSPEPETPDGHVVAQDHSPDSPHELLHSSPLEFEDEVPPPVSGGAPDSEDESATESPTATDPSDAVPSDEPTAADHTPTPTMTTSEPAAPTPSANTEDHIPEAPEASAEHDSHPAPEASAEHDSQPAPEASVSETAGSPVVPSTTPSSKPQGGRPGQGRGGSGGKRPPKNDQRPPRPKPVFIPPARHPADAVLAALSYVIVNEAGASHYSTSQIGRDEFPDLDANTRGTVSIGRRLQDPLSELVKIEPQNIGVGLYQHDVNPKHLKESLETVIESCVNFVGVDLNTASVPLLRHISGLNQLTAKRIYDHRQTQGPFRNREQLKAIEGIGEVTYTQSAGFLKLRGGEEPLDRTWIHPESYPVARKALELLGFSPEVILNPERLPELREKLNEVDLSAFAKELEIGEPTLDDIFRSLARPERDPRDDLPKPIFKKGVLKLEDLEAGMELKGTVLNVVDFGAFVDIGLKDSGLVHISQLANRYIKSPHDVVSVGDVVSVWVLTVDHDRKRVSLTMVQPGTERPRPTRRGSEGGNQEPGPRREGAAGPSGIDTRRRGDRPGPGGPGAGVGRPPRRDHPVGVGPAAAPGSSEGDASRASGAPGSQGGGEGQGYGRPSGGARMPGPPQRGGGGPGRGPRPGGGGGGGPRYGSGGQRSGGQGGPGAGRPGDRTPTPRPTPRPKPAPPPPPLSKDALSGNVPLRTFGQLKQLWQAREDGPDDETSPTEGATAPPPDVPPSPSPDAPPQSSE